MGSIVSKEEFDKLDKYMQIKQLTYDEWNKSFVYFMNSIKTNYEFYDLRNGEMLYHHEPIINTYEDIINYNKELNILGEIITNMWTIKKR